MAVQAAVKGVGIVPASSAAKPGCLHAPDFLQHARRNSWWRDKQPERLSGSEQPDLVCTGHRDNSQTRVLYQNQTYNPTYLQSGDQVYVQLYDSGNGQYVADTINIVQRSASNNGYPNNSPNNGNQSSDIRGTVTYVDTQAQRIDLSVNYMNGLRNSQSSSSSFYYDSSTRVLYQNRNYAPTDLERGDQVEVLAYNNGNGRFLADTVTVTRNVRQ